MINRALKISREFHRIKQKDLAESLGISPSYLSQIETGNKSPSLELLVKYGEIFDVPPSTFLVFVEQASGQCSGQPTSKNAHRLLKFLEWVMEDDFSGHSTALGSHNEKKEQVTA